MNNYEKIRESFNKYKQKAKVDKYIACFGKTFISKSSLEYRMSKKIGYLNIKQGFGVIHGGYSGVMEAISFGADKAINEFDAANKYWNIGVPMKTFDKSLKRSSRVNLPACNDILDRKRALIELCDICVVLPSGGIGTVLETLGIFHLNQIAEKFGGKIRPIIFIGSNWKRIIKYLLSKLNMSSQSIGDNFTYFCKNYEDYEKLIKKLSER